MTIEEYKEKFVELFKQLSKEHGLVESVRICKVTDPIWLQEAYKCNIEF